MIYFYFYFEFTTNVKRISGVPRDDKVRTRNVNLSAIDLTAMTLKHPIQRRNHGVEIARFEEDCRKQATTGHRILWSHGEKSPGHGRKCR